MSTKIDITGKRFGRLVALSPTNKRYNRQVIWKCLCDCGNISFVTCACLRSGNTKSCGCVTREKTAERSRKDIAGKRFGKLVALKPIKKRSRNGDIIWECLCDCGSIAFVVTASLIRGRTKSCKCLQKDAVVRDIKGYRFGRLVVLKATNHRQSGCIIYKCQCDCGNITFVNGTSLRRGFTKSCGCLIYASRFVLGTILSSMEVPFEITDCMQAICKLKKAIKQAS